MKGKVYLIGCGTGDPELLTIKAVKIFEKLEVALIDHLIPDEIVQLLPKKTKVMYVGKQKGKLSIKQEDINNLLYEFAKEGITVGRLKSGDPYVFGRGGEEAVFLTERGIEVQVIPGVSSATVSPLEAGIPVVMRGVSTSFSVVSAHLAGNRFNKDWIELLKKKNHTVIVLMGISRAKDIIKEAKKQNVNLNIPVAVVSNASRSNQKVLIGSLKEIEKIVQKAEKPAVMIFGDVVKLHHKLYNHNFVNKNQQGEAVQWKN